jgi:hypothetical protein
MSGCVNCVWDQYRDEMEAWASANAEADRRLAAREADGSGLAESADSTAAQNKQVGKHTPGQGPAAASMEDDGGGRETNWDTTGMPKIAADFWDEELYKNLPVGIREFMKQEKRLKEKHLREGTSGG